MIRPGITRVALALAVASTTVGMVPAAHARPNDGRFQRWLHSHNHQVSCENYKTMANYDSDKAHDAYAAGDKAGGDYWQKAADEDFNIAVNAQCAWATRIVAKNSKLSAIVSPVALARARR